MQVLRTAWDDCVERRALSISKGAGTEKRSQHGIVEGRDRYSSALKAFLLEGQKGEKGRLVQRDKVIPAA